MIFSSETFLFLFLPVFLGGYYLTPNRFRSMTILAGSYVFYGWWRVDFLGLLVLTTLWTYLFGLAIERAPTMRLRKLALTLGLAGCLGVLAVFKYLNFFVDSLAALAGTDAAGLGIHWRLILPIGISFYVFQSISYLIDVHRNDVRATTSFFDFAAFIALFPQLVAGPILRFKDLADQFQDRQHTPQMFADGLARFTIGLAKKVLIADALAPLADMAFATPDPTAPLAWAGALAYALQLYFDFSGYSDMAIGLGMMMGFRFMENFDAPYVSRSITEFWRRWHISLSVWLRDYLYVPLGGNRKGPLRTYVNLVLVMLLGGLWHGANWTFVLWGAWHGGWLAAERALGISRKKSGGLDHLRTMFIVLLGWVMFRATSVGQAGHVYAGLFGLNGWELPPEIALHLPLQSFVLILLAGIIALSEPQLRQWTRLHYFPTSGESLGADLANTAAPRPPLTPANTLLPSLLVTGLAVLCVMRLAEQSFSPFLYFQF